MPSSPKLDDEGLPPAEAAFLPLPVVQNSERPTNRGCCRRTALAASGHWAYLKRRLGTVTAQSATSIARPASNVDRSDSYSTRRQGGRSSQENDEKNQVVDQVVVDRVWPDDPRIPLVRDHSACAETSAASCEPSRSLEQSSVVNDQSNVAPAHPANALFYVLRWRTWPVIMNFFSPRFPDEKDEAHYQQENWCLRKVCSGTSTFLVYVVWLTITTTSPSRYAPLCSYSPTGCLDVHLSRIPCHSWTKSSTSAYVVSSVVQLVT
jgi:osomolarity two-component system, sensor histidine kinase SLN1